MMKTRYLLTIRKMRRKVERRRRQRRRRRVVAWCLVLDPGARLWRRR